MYHFKYCRSAIPFKRNMKYFEIVAIPLQLTKKIWRCSHGPIKSDFEGVSILNFFSNKRIEKSRIFFVFIVYLKCLITYDVWYKSYRTMTDSINYKLYAVDLLRMSKVDFSPGSSNEGKAFRHPVDSNWVVAK